MHGIRAASLIALVATAACSGRQPAPSSEPPAPPPPSSPSTPPPPPPSAPTLPAAPWRQPALASSAVPAVYAAEWRKAANRATCAPLAPASLGRYAAAEPRAATFSGGWAVAYDLPATRSAFGIAGSGSRASDPAYSAWPYHLRWADGSTAGYGPEGGTGPKQLAYLRVAGQDCLYNVWSHLGREHLEELLSQLRFVQVPR